jgi:uncharacterized lipoprotein YmbA
MAKGALSVANNSAALTARLDLKLDTEALAAWICATATFALLISSISVDILQFGVDASGTVVLEGSWSLALSGTDLAAANHRFHLSQRV